MDSRVTVHREAWTIPGTEEWIARNATVVYNCLRSIGGDCSLVESKLPHFRKWAEAHAIEWSEYCVEQLGVTPAFIDLVVRGIYILRGKGHEGPITKADAVAAAAAQAVPAPSHAEVVAAQVEKGRKGFKPKSSDSDAITNVTRGSTGAEYLTARIARDHPAILERMKAGEFASVRAAARAAGILKPIDPVRAALRAFGKLTTEERCAFFEAIQYVGDV